MRKIGMDTATIEELKNQWANRSTAHKRTSLQHQNTQERLVPLLTLPEDLRWKTFQLVAEARKWTPKVKDSYWAAMGSAAAILSIPRTKISQDAQRITKSEAQKQKSWEEEDPRQLVTTEYINTIEQKANAERLPRTMQLVTAMSLAFMLGQRLGDTLKWRTSEIKFRHFFEAAPSVAVTIVEGKTVETTGQYTIHCPVASRAGQMIRTALAFANGKYLFIDSPKYLEKDLISHEVLKAETYIHKQLKQWGNDIDLRALRRGGLVRMATCGFSNQIIRLFSRHASDAQLDVYLGRGTFAGGMAKIQSEVIARTEEFAESVAKTR